MTKLDDVERQIQETAQKRAAVWCKPPTDDNDTFQIAKLTVALAALYEEKRFIVSGEVDLWAARDRARVEKTLERLATPA
jgi:hypothetical protein